MLGDKNVGKTVFFNGCLHKNFNDPMLNTIGINEGLKYIKLDNVIYKLTMTDTSGSRKFKFYNKNIYEKIDGIFLIFDVTNEKTFSTILSFIKDIQENKNQNMNNASENNRKELSLFLIWNKIDKSNRVVSKEKAEEIAHSFGMKYFELSCKINMNINEVISKMIIECHTKIIYK